MSQQVWMVTITVIYCALMMFLSWYIGKKTTKDETEFMVGGREFNAFMTAVGNGSILISGGYLPSIIMYGYMFGMGGAWYYIGWGTGALVAWLFWAGFWRTTGALTPTEWFEYRYGKGGRMAITFVVLFASLAILGWQYVGCGATVGAALGISTNLAIFIVGIVVTAYVTFGGIWAATATDVIQFSWVVVVQFVVLPIFLIAKYGMPQAALLPDKFLSLPFGAMPVFKFVVPSVISFLMMHQSLLNQSPYWARAAGTRSLKSLKKGWLWTWIIAYATGIIGAFTGCYVRQLLGELPNGASTAFGSLMNILPVGLAACIMAGLMAATMSTCDIYLVACVNQLVRDVSMYFLKITDSKKLLNIAKWGTVAVGLVSVIFAMFWKGGLSYLFAFGTGVGAPLFVYYLDSWLLRVGNQIGAIASVIVSMLIVLIMDILTPLGKSCNSLWLIFPLCFLTLVIVSKATKKDEVKPVAEEGPDELQTEILKELKRGFENTGDVITSMTAFNNERQIQAAEVHHAFDSLERSGYITRRGQRKIAQLYFDLTEKGNAWAESKMDKEEVSLINTYGVGQRAKEFMTWIKDGKDSLSDISGKHNVYMMELSTLTENLDRLGYVKMLGAGRLSAELTPAGQDLLNRMNA